MGPPPPMPALLTRTSMCADRPSTVLTAPVTEAALSTSRTTGRIGSFSPSAAAVSSVAVAGLRTPACTSWPSRAKWSAVARPMPLLLPVIRTTDMRTLYQIRSRPELRPIGLPHGRFSRRSSGGAGDADDHVLELLLAPRRGHRRALHGPEARPDADGLEVGGQRLAHREVGRPRVEVAGVEAARIAGLGEELLGLLRVVGGRFEGARELEDP